jgi:hypothetical protein
MVCVIGAQTTASTITLHFVVGIDSSILAGGRAQLEQGVMAGVRDAVLDRGIATKWDEQADERRGKPTPQVRRDGIVEEGASDFRRQLDCNDPITLAAVREDGLAIGAQVAHPVHLAVWRLHEASPAALHERDGERPGQSALAAADGEEDVRPEREPGAHEPPD